MPGIVSAPRGKLYVMGNRTHDRADTPPPSVFPAPSGEAPRQGCPTPGPRTGTGPWPAMSPSALPTRCPGRSFHVISVLNYGNENTSRPNPDLVFAQSSTSSTLFLRLLCPLNYVFWFFVDWVDLII